MAKQKRVSDLKRRKRKTVKPDQGKRNFLTVFSAFIGSIIGIAIAFPVIGFIFHPLIKKTVYGGSDFINIAKSKAIKPGIPKKVVISSFKVDGWNRYDNIILGAAWLIKQENGEIVAKSSICPHLGCGIDWDAGEGQFVCPCHKSIFDIDGKVVSGPAPRPMDSLDIKIEDGDVFVKHRKLRLATHKVIEV